MEQIWAIISFGEGRFSVSDTGNIRNNLTGKYMATQIQNSGYRLSHLTYKGIRKALTIHRLVAMAFVENPESKLFVDHKDCNKQNNHYTNLRWVTNIENMRFASENGCLKNVAEKAAIRMTVLGNKYGFAHSQEYLKKAIPLDLFIDNKAYSFRSLREAAKHIKIDHKTLAARIEKGMYALPDLQLQF